MTCLLCLHALQLEDGSTEIRRLSRCLSQALFPSSGFNQLDIHMVEQANIKKVIDITYNPVVT